VQRNFVRVIPRNNPLAVYQERNARDVRERTANTRFLYNDESLFFVFSAGKGERKKTLKVLFIVFSSVGVKLLPSLS
jgi:hypothetical protein